MKKKIKFKMLSPTEEGARASMTLLKGSCFITKESLSNKPYELVWHAGAQSYVFVDKEYMSNT